MDVEKIKEKLNKLLYKKRLLKSLKLQIEQFIEDCCCIMPVDYSKDKVVGDSRTSSVERCVIRLQSLQEKYEKLLTEIMEIEDFIAEKLIFLDETEQSMIIDRYINGWSWGKICRTYHYSERQPFYIVNKAIKKIMFYGTLQ